MSTRVRVIAAILCMSYLTDKYGCAGTARSSIDEHDVRDMMHVQEWADAIDLWQGKNMRLMVFQRTGLGIWIRYLEKKGRCCEKSGSNRESFKPVCGRES